MTEPNKDAPPQAVNGPFAWLVQSTTERNPDVCRYYLASDDEASKFNDPAHVDKQIDTDRANMEARDRARKA